MKYINHIKFPMNMIKLALHRALWPKFGYQENPEVLNESLIKRQQNHKLAT